MYLSDHNIRDMPKQYRTNFVNSLSGFKSANLIGTQSQSGCNNLALFSSAVHLGANPALMGIISRPDSVTRDTLTNIRETGYFSLNHVHKGMIEAAHQCAARYPSDVSEFDAVGLTPQTSQHHPAPYVKESHLSMGLKSREIMTIAINNCYLIIGEIIEVKIENEAIQKDGTIALDVIQTVAISGLDHYHTTQLIHQYSYAKPDRPLSIKK